MADEIKDMRIDAAAKLSEASVVPNRETVQAPDAPRSPRTALVNSMVECATTTTNEELSRVAATRKDMDPRTVALLDDKNLQACIDDFARNVRSADNAATNNLPKGNNSGRER